MLEVKHLTVRSKEGRPLVRDVSFTLTPRRAAGPDRGQRLGQDHNHQGGHGDSALWLCH